MSALSPVARMLSPIRVPRNHTRKSPAMIVIPAARMSLYHAPPIPVSFIMVNNVLCFKRLTLELHPMTIRFTVQRPVFVTIPARIDGTPSLVCKNAVTNPAQDPAAIAARIARNGCPAAATVTDTAAPRTNPLSVVRSAISRIRQLKKRAIATNAYIKPSSRAV